MIIAARIIVIIVIVITIIFIIIIIIIIIIIATIYTIFTLPFEKKKNFKVLDLPIPPTPTNSPAKGTPDSEEKASVDETPWRVLAVGIFSPKITMIEGFFRPSQSWEVFSLDSGGTVMCFFLSKLKEKCPPKIVSRPTLWSLSYPNFGAITKCLCTKSRTPSETTNEKQL